MQPEHYLAAGLLGLVCLLAGVRIGRGHSQRLVNAAFDGGYDAGRHVAARTDAHAALVTEADHAD